MEQRQKLPKNVRQVGDKEDRFRIYLEDYANTYLSRYASYEDEVTFGVLVGTSCVLEGNAYLFIHGAIEVNYVWQGKEIVFSEQCLVNMQQTKRDYFPEGELCGVFVCGDEDSLPEFSVLENLQRRYFPQAGSLMYLCNGDDSLFLYRMGGSFSALRGFYIYYERNEAMQNFMVEHNKGSRVETPQQEAVIEDFRQKLEERKQNALAINSIRVANVACALLTVAVLILSVYAISSGDKLRDLEQMLAGLTGTTASDDGVTVNASLPSEGTTEDPMEHISVEYITGEQSSEVHTEAAGSGEIGEGSEPEIPIS